jgi:hypothetical protein
MENLTQTYGVVKPNVPSAPMEGYNVVVLEDIRGGTKFKTILNPGDKPLVKRKGIFYQSPDYGCYAVNLDTNLNFEFSAEMILAALHQHFSLNCTVYYYVSDTKAMALTFRSDPIKRTREEIKRRLQRNILESKIEINDIQDKFYKVKEKILPDTTFNQLLEFSAKFGIIIKEIEMTYKVPEIYLVPDRKREEYNLKKETASIEAEERHQEQKVEKDNLIHTHKIDEMKIHHAQRMKDLESVHEFQRKMLDKTVEGIGKTVERINSPESLVKTADAAIEVIKRAADEIQNSDHTYSEKQIAPTATQMNSLMSENSDSSEDPKSFLLKILAKVENSTSQSPERKALLSCITHLLGEIQLEEKGNPEIIEKYIDQLKENAVKYGKIFTRSVMEQISELKEKCNKRSAQTPGTSEQQDNTNNTDVSDTPAPSNTSTTADTPGVPGTAATANSPAAPAAANSSDK